MLACCSSYLVRGFSPSWASQTACCRHLNAPTWKTFQIDAPPKLDYQSVYWFLIRSMCQVWASSFSHEKMASWTLANQSENSENIPAVHLIIIKWINTVSLYETVLHFQVSNLMKVLWHSDSVQMFCLSRLISYHIIALRPSISSPDWMDISLRRSLCAKWFGSDQAVASWSWMAISLICQVTSPPLSFLSGPSDNGLLLCGPVCNRPDSQTTRIAFFFFLSRNGPVNALCTAHASHLSHTSQRI